MKQVDLTHPPASGPNRATEIRAARRTVTGYGRKNTVHLRYHPDRLRYGSHTDKSVYGTVRRVLRPETAHTAVLQENIYLRDEIHMLLCTRAL